MNPRNQFFLFGTLLLVFLLTACGRIQVDIVPTPEPLPRPGVPITPTPWFGPAQYETEAGVIFDDRLKLHGYTVTPDSDQPGSRVTVTLIWEVLGKIDADYNTFVHLLNEEGQLVAQSDRPTGGGYRQSSSWIVKEYVYDQHHLQLPVSMGLDEVSIQIGLYNFKDGRRIDVESPNTYTLEVAARPTTARPLLPPMTPRPYHPTPFDALTEWPGRLEDAQPALLESVRVLNEQEVAGGVVLLYSKPAVESGENTLASTFVTPEDDGWRAQSSGWTNYSSADEFVAAYTVGGNITDLTTAYGIGRKGESVRVEWSDGQVDTAPIENESFVFARPETLTVQRIELLDENGGVLQSKAYGAEAAETPGEILMATPTATPLSPTSMPAGNKTGLSQVDQTIKTILSNDLDARQSLVRFASAGCITAGGLGSLPACAEGQAEGTAVEFLPLGGPGEGHPVLPADVAGVLDFDVDAIYGAYVVAPDLPDEPEYPHGAYAIYFLTDGGTTSGVFRLDDEGYIVRLDTLGSFPVEMHFLQKTAGLIDPPPETEMFRPEAISILLYPPGISRTSPAANATDPTAGPENDPSTGIPQVDQAIAAVLSNDVKTRRDLIRYTTTNCTHELGMGGPPKCEPGQEEGTPVEKFPILGPGEGEHIDPEVIDRVLGFRVEELYAAYRRADGEDRDSSFPAGAFGLVFISENASDELSRILVHLDEEGRIVRLDFVAWPLEQYFEQEVGEWLLEPQT